MTRNLTSNMGKYVICIAFLLVSSLLNAQETIVTYIKKDGGHTALKDSAEYTSVLRITPNEDGLYLLNEYYANGNLKRQGWVKTADPKRLRFEGTMETYHDDGTLETRSRYADNRQIDTSERYYRNGILKERFAYLTLTEEQADSKPFMDSNTRLVYYADSTGNVQVRDGNGNAEIFVGDVDTERGQYLEGRRSGRWEGTFQKKKYRFEEWYENGEVTKGVTTDSLGQQFEYEKSHILPEYPNGIHSLRAFIAQNFHYPREALQAKVGGQLKISFVVDKTGRPTEYKIVNDLGYGTGKEAINVIKKTKDWSPGYNRGIPVRVAYTLPIQLQL